MLFCVVDASTNSSRLVVQSRTSGDRRVLIEDKDGAQFIQAHYLETGRIVYVKGGILFGIPFDLQKLETTGNPAPVIQGVRQAFLQEPILSIPATDL